MKRNNFEYGLESIRKREGLSERYEVEAKSFSNCTTPITSLKSIEVEVDFFVKGESVELIGYVNSKAKTLCSRCGKEIDISMKGEFENSYTGNDLIDIKPLIEEAITLSEPMKSICSPECSGGHIEKMDFKRFKIEEGENYAKSKEKTHKVKKR
jgi:uncharacterized metal-binding protein YceD (DUF177 family)